MPDCFKYAVLILSAGESTRMGCFPKALLDCGRGATFLENIIRGIGFLNPRPVGYYVVLGYHREKIEEKVDLADCRVIVNPHPDKGMISSIIEGLTSITTSTKGKKIKGILMTLVDHPLVKPETYQAILDEAVKNPGCIIIPLHNNRKGHPVFFPQEIFQDLINSPIDQGARWAVRKNSGRIKMVEVDDPHIYSDIDTPEIYRETIKMPVEMTDGQIF
jgi:molybdenum cofactor cytidylyltransferase